MASSLYSLHSTTTSITANISTTEIHRHLSPKTSQLSLSRALGRHPTPRVSCKITKNDDQNPKTNTESDNNNTNKFDRRHMLIGLGGLYGAATTLNGAPYTLAAPIQTPNPSACGPPDVPSNAEGLNCCPPQASTIIDFVLPSPPTTLRVRPPAHLVDDEYMQKFSRAISIMRDLPADDPRNFIQQANVHCAYCNGGYSQVGFPNLDLQVHGSWLFFPFHRWYLYFFEKILGSLIDDPTFAIPFWNWDAPEGMSMPIMYTDPNSPLYDPIRDGPHQPPKLLDLNYDGDDTNDLSDQALTQANLTLMNRQMVSNARTARLFLGQPYRAGNAFSPGGGSIENTPHGPVHVWTGDRNQPNFEDMGNFYSAARDPLFYAHHANVDRTWFIWKTLSTNNRDFTDSDWLNASFIFYDENAQAVRVRVRDCLDTSRLGYTYQNVALPWLNARPTARSSRVQTVTSTPQAANAMESLKSSNVTFPKPLKKAIRTNVARPKKSRSKKEKNAEEEVLVIDVDVLRHDKYVKFDVYINDEDDAPSKKNQMKAEYAGSFVNVPHKHKHGESVHKTSLRVGLTELIEELGADDDDGVMVTLVPRSGKDNVVIKSVTIEFSS